MPYLVDPPASRRLRIFTFDPSLATVLETSSINQIVLSIPWEKGLLQGPVGEYIEVVDYDPASGTGYAPVDLNDPNLLARDGLLPSESNPQFHQQMVYAVAMTTISHFERALGRVAFWGDRRFKVGNEYRNQFVRRLRIYPHAIRDRNAYYSPAKKAILFGYFPATSRDRHTMPGTLVYTCLSHDIIAHEVTHALLDGVHPRFNEPSNPDVHAFHEAFADIVALFQHFSYPVVLESQISKTRGNLESESLLSQLAQQFGQATGRGTALRDALGGLNKAGKWEARQPDPLVLQKTMSPHDRGSILVAAVFRAFLLIYRSRTADLFRIATGGSGALPEGEIHPDLTRRLSREAAACADRVLQMCIRAIDYCPPVDITFGDFLRAIVTADIDYMPEEEGSFRIVFIESFREWGIYPRSVTNLGIETLAWPTGDDLMENLLASRQGVVRGDDFSKSEMAGQKLYLKSFFTGNAVEWNLESDRFEVWKSLDPLRFKWWKWLYEGDHYKNDYAMIFGLVLDGSNTPATVYRDEHGNPTVEVHAVRPTIRRTSRGSIYTAYIVEITQRRRGYFDAEEQKRKDALTFEQLKADRGDFIFRSGCTILIDPATQEILRVIRTCGTITDNAELERVRKFKAGELAVNGNAFDSGLALSLGITSNSLQNEPFALLHSDPL
ncbi:MAG: hypothetical protein BGO21_19075 [Dyadobacter sp. 50-39]|uniref:hypothetical protein n=1 Tax=Dyadobacter sp. 50-39 TaxID=1895756 RepID=UPI0009627F88|nr:hypothetical protein [Dyadobacter sp. 50-39]OJV14795.1 MAG: hypothetical protein BGO21_19075 [Dyadobacter sp. 50-39]